VIYIGVRRHAWSWSIWTISWILCLPTIMSIFHSSITSHYVEVPLQLQIGGITCLKAVVSNWVHDALEEYTYWLILGYVNWSVLHSFHLLVIWDLVNSADESLKTYHTWKYKELNSSTVSPETCAHTCFTHAASAENTSQDHCFLFPLAALKCASVGGRSTFYFCDVCQISHVSAGSIEVLFLNH
jgi:hypothetical protein